jgi:hypothetical protein
MRPSSAVSIPPIRRGARQELYAERGTICTFKASVEWCPPPRWAFATWLETVKPPTERVLHIDHMFVGMQRLKKYEAKTNAMTRIGSNLSQVLPPPFSCE